MIRKDLKAVGSVNNSGAFGTEVADAVQRCYLFGQAFLNSDQWWVIA